MRQPLIFPVLFHKSATTCQSDLCNCVKAEINESLAPPQQPYKRETFFWDTLYSSRVVSYFACELHFERALKRTRNFDNETILEK